MREEIEKKIKELEWRTNVRSLDMIDWLKFLLTKLPEECKKEEQAPKEVVVELPEVEKKVVATRKITFKKKK